MAQLLHETVITEEQFAKKNPPWIKRWILLIRKARDQRPFRE